MSELSHEYVTEAFADLSQQVSDRVQQYFDREMVEAGYTQVATTHRGTDQKRYPQAQQPAAEIKLAIWTPEQATSVPMSVLSKIAARINLNRTIVRKTSIILSNYEDSDGLRLNLHEIDKTDEWLLGEPIPVKYARQIDRNGNIETTEQLDKYMRRTIGALAWLGADDFPNGDPFGGDAITPHSPHSNHR